MENDYFKLIEVFTRSDCDRFQFIRSFLTANRVPFSIIPLGHCRFIHIHPPQKTEIAASAETMIFTAHYDRAAGSPGANDNSAAVLDLLFFSRLLFEKNAPLPVQILFTDQEEVPKGTSARTQGSFRLGELLGMHPGLRFVSLHFDMCGRGDTVILSEAGERLLERRKKTATVLYKKMKALRISVLETLSRHFRGRLLTLPTPFSDNLGFLLQGFASLQFTLLPFQEANAYQLQYKKLMKEITTLKQGSGEIKADLKKRFSEIQPLTWKLRHSDRDTTETLTKESFHIMENLLAALCKCKIPLIR
jgi:hypothetical protein